MTDITNQLPEMIAAAADDKKARDIVILDMQGISSVTDFFVICSANSTTQVAAIADNIEEKLSEKGINPLHKEGYREAHWILLDYGTCVVHIFIEEDRNFYNLERLWGDAQSRSYEA
ncbi:ribosomal silencing factor during starvation [Lucifera butyrica]|uniref:Ribosomal silencing factor RsfS n=1 Tax=Lucifera butyrica TaxID=1351585 RepID=A0A498R796_9FIRM|nr:ribosome silencing factor [Lucifera butyrica]VBB06800.1 ribosomal silencing factor during starvation [Lucifera butyrica]